MSHPIFCEIVLALRAQFDRGESVLTPTQLSFLETLSVHGINEPRAHRVLLNHLERLLPGVQGELPFVDPAQDPSWSLPLSAVAWSEIIERPAPFGTSHEALAVALGRLDATFSSPANDPAAHLNYVHFRQAFLPFTDISPNPWGPIFRSIPALICELDTVFPSEDRSPSALAYASLRQACFKTKASQVSKQVA